jgi:hypothetical protein
MITLNLSPHFENALTQAADSCPASFTGFLDLSGRINN